MGRTAAAPAEQPSLQHAWYTDEYLPGACRARNGARI